MYPLIESISKCLPCMSPRHHRVAPENSVHIGRTQTVVSRTNHEPRSLRDELNGEVNLHFVSDGDDESHVVIECPTVCDYPPDPLASTTLSEIETFEAKKKRRNSIIDDKASYGNNNSYLTTLFIETAKRKQLRVVHYRAIDDEDEDDDEDEADDGVFGRQPKVQFDPGDESLVSSRVSKRRKDMSSSGSEDEDEYWFSKWSRRPRLKKQEKKIFESYSSDQDSRNLNGIIISNNSGECTILDAESGDRSVSFSLPLPDVTLNDSEAVVDTGITKRPVTPPDDSDSCVGFTNLGFQPDDREENNKTATVEEGTLSSNSSMEVSRTDIENANPKMSTESLHEDSAQIIIQVSNFSDQEEIVEEEEEDDSVLDNHRIIMSEIPSKPVKPLLFFIHSISGSSDVWKSQIQYFHQLGYEIAAMDLLGHGLSGTPAQAKLYHFESLVQDVVTVFDHFVTDEQRQVVVIGHGYGACLATVLTRIRPKNICILVSISGGGPTPMVSSFWCESPWIPLPCSWFPRRKKHGRFENPDLRHVLPRNIHENIIYGQIWLDGDPAFHRRITVPSLLVYGLKDKVVNLVEVCEMERTIPRAYLELIPTAGHMVMWDEPNKLNRMIRKFIQAQWS